MTTAAMLDVTFSPTDDVHYQYLGEEAVLLDIRTGVYFGLDAVGTRIWDLLVQGTALGGIVEVLGQEFDAHRSTLVRDVTNFVQTLDAKGLVRMRAAQA